MNDSGTEKTLRRAAIFVMAAIVVTGLHLGQALLIPLALALFLSLLLNAPARVLQRTGMGRGPSVVIVFIVAVLGIGSVGWVIFDQASAIVSDLPQYQQNIESKFSDLQERFSRTRAQAESITRSLTKDKKSATSVKVAAKPGEPGEAPARAEAVVNRSAGADGEVRVQAEGTTTQPVQVEVVETPTNILDSVGDWWEPVTHPLATGGLTIILLFFLLIHREDLRDRLLRICGRAHIQITTAALADSEARIVRFFGAQAISNILVGTAVGLGLFALGVPKAALWGLMLAILRFIPFLGPVIAVGFPVVLSAAVTDGWIVPILVIVLAGGMDMLAGNFLEPWLFGIRVGASPPAIFLSFIVWGTLWGPAGLLLATPIMVCLIVLGKHVPAFETFYVLFGNEPVLEPSLRFYQRMLALNSTEAKDVVKKHVEESSLADALETVVWPGLSLVESDRLEGLIDVQRAEKARKIAADIITKLMEDRPEEKREPVARVRPNKIMVLPDRGLFDELLVPQVMEDIEFKGNAAQLIPAATLVSEIVEQVEAERPDMFAFCTLEPRSVDRIVHIHKRLSRAGISIPMNVLLISGTKRAPSLRRRLARLNNVRVCDTVSEFVTGMEPSLAPAEGVRQSMDGEADLAHGVGPKPATLTL